MMNYDRDLAIAADRHANPEAARQADEAYGEAMEAGVLKETCLAPQPTCKQCNKAPATEDYQPGWPVCGSCLRKMSE